MEVSIVLPVHNGEAWLDECLASVVAQTFSGTLEVSIYNDCSNDNSLGLIEKWKEKLEEHAITVILSGHTQGEAKGVGYAKNRAVNQSTGKYLCFLDADDVMHPERISQQHATAEKLPQNTLLGSGFYRDPQDSTVRYTKWANTLNSKQLYTQAYTSHGPTVIMPTWFCHRNVFMTVKGFNEDGKGTPEDLLFFYRHLRHGGQIHRVDGELLMYRYHPLATTFSVHEDTIWEARLSAIQEQVLADWEQFTIWNAGKQGRKFYRSLRPEHRKKVRAFCDVDQRKIEKGLYIFEESQDSAKPRVPIIHFTQAKPPFIICVKQDLTGGKFEENLSSLYLEEGKNYFHFN